MRSIPPTSPESPPGEETSLDGAAVLVTGGAGFIGSHLVDALLPRCRRVRILDDLSSGRRGNLPERRDAGDLAAVELLEGDVRDPEACRAACRGIDLVFHQAALGSVPRSLESPGPTLAVNAMGTAELLDAARRAGVGRVVFASSSSVYGASERLPKREGEEGAPLSPYAASKLFQESLAELFGDCYGLETVGLRYFNVFGPRQRPDGPYAAVVPRFFEAALAGEPLEIYGDGEQSRDFTYVTDAVAANLLAAQAPAEACGGSYNVAAGRRVTVNELAAAVLELAGGGDTVHRPPRAGEARHSHADLTLAAERLGYAPSTSLERGLEASLEHYRRLLAGRAALAADRSLR